MVGNRGWLGTIRRAFIGSSCKTAAVLLDVSQNTETVTLTEEVDVDAREENVCINEEGNLPTGRKLYWEDLAAIKIQACFRGHLARRAFRALRSLVKLQAVVRGVCVRRQARIAVHCMQVLVRLQVRVRARQLLNRSEGLENSRPL